MKKDWEYKTIKEIGTVIGGTTPSTNNKEYWNGEHCWISPAELDGSHYLYDSVRKVTDKAVKDKNLKLLPIGTVILSSRAPIGKVTINKIPTYCNQGFKCVICGNRVYNEFLYWWFWGKTEYLNSIGTGATFKEISKKVVENIIIPIPPLSEQKEIVEYLDSSFAKIDKLKENAAKNLEEAKALFQSALKNALEPKEGWEEKTLPDISENLDSKRIPITKGKRDSGKYPYYGASGIVDYVGDYIFDEDILLLSEDGANLLARSTPIAFSVSGKVWVNNHAHILKFKDMCTQRFVEYFFASKDISEYVTGAAQPKLSQKKMNIIPISIPSLQEQQSIVSYLDSLNEKVNTLQKNYSRICDECDALKQAILRQVFE